MITEQSESPYTKLHFPLSDHQTTLRQASEKMNALPGFLTQDEIPLIIKLMENPKYSLPGVDIFHGAADLETHDFIHPVLGRGFLPKDEAFVIGFTMGCTNKMSTWVTRTFSNIAKYLYPKGYRFSDEDIRIFKDSVHLGWVSDCTPLTRVDFHTLLDLPLVEVRQRIGLEDSLLRAYFEIEHKRYPGSRASQRLLD